MPTPSSQLSGSRSGHQQSSLLLPEASPVAAPASSFPRSSQPSGLHLPLPNGEAFLSSGPERVRVDGKFFSREGRRIRMQGVTYGPFAPNAAGEMFSERPRVETDLRAMKAAGINSLRTYYAPPEWFMEACDEAGMTILVDIPWPKHLCFLESPESQREARRLVKEATARGKRFASVFAYSIGNEIPTDVARWHGADKIERFIGDLADLAKQTDPSCLVTYANYPSTEYLDLSFLDFHTFNVYLHDPNAFSAYLMRLQNIAGERPLLLGEMGMDTFRHSEDEQAHFISGHMREAILAGVAGGYVFSWTDDWFTGGYQIEDWAFGLTRVDREPKPSYHALGEVLRRSPSELLPATPRVSVVVCSYNGGATLDQCLRSLCELDYPNYEVILVDDGSTDNTREIVSRFPDVHAIHQPNKGLSVARNVGMLASTGDIVAYTDSDCYADPHWLTYLVRQFQRTGAQAVGGPNLTPEDGALAACIAASPGQPTHVLESDEIAEHIPGCNMAYTREALMGIEGFDPIYRKAGDDVDVCWRLEESGGKIGFAPGAFVWHHRRQTPRTYFKQQAGYGEAEALLRLKHPHRFTERGEGKWRGVLYGASLSGLRLSGRTFFRGVFGSGLFQCVYQPGPAHWAMLPSTLEWHFAAGALTLAGLVAPTAWIGTAGMLAASLFVAGVQAAQAKVPREHDSWKARLTVAALTYAQPLVRSWWRYRTRFDALRTPNGDADLDCFAADALPLTGERTVEYWSEEWRDRTELLDRLTTHLRERDWSHTVDAGWSDWDLEIRAHPWTSVRMTTVQEDHGSGKRLIRVRYRLQASEYTRAFGVAALVTGVAALACHSAPVAALAGTAAMTAGALWAWGSRQAARVVSVVDLVGHRLGLIRCDAGAEREANGEAGVPVAAGIGETEL